MKLEIKKVEIPQTIEFNFEELKNEIEAKAEFYQNIVYTDDTIKEAKADKASLNKFITALENKRKEIKKQCLEPYNEFEKRIKELVAIIDAPVRLIGEQIDEFENKEKEEKKEKIEELFEATGFQSFVELEQVFEPKWLNKSTSLKSIEDSLIEQMHRIGHDVTAINALEEFKFEAMEHYKKTLDLSSAIAEGQRLADIQRRKAEYEARIKEAETQATPEPVEDVAHPEPQTEDVKPSTEPLPAKQWIKFEALLSKDDALALKEFCKIRKIDIKSIK